MTKTAFSQHSENMDGGTRQLQATQEDRPRGRARIRSEAEIQKTLRFLREGTSSERLQEVDHVMKESGF